MKLKMHLLDGLLESCQKGCQFSFSTGLILKVCSKKTDKVSIHVHFELLNGGILR